MSEKKVWTINGEKLELKQITIAGTKKLLALFSDLDIDETSNFLGLLDKLVDEKLAGFMEIIFGPDAAAISWEEVPFDTVDEMVSLFFDINPRLKARLQQLFGSLVSTQAA